MKRIIMTEFCDYCWQDGKQETPATQTITVTMAIGAKRPITAPRVVLTCDVHAKPLAELAQVIAKCDTLDGHEIDEPSSITYKAPQEACEVCGATYTRSALVTHIWSNHIGRPRPTSPTACPDCDYTAPNSTSIGVHRRNSHGYNVIADTMAVYEAEQAEPAKPKRGRPRKAS